MTDTTKSIAQMVAERPSVNNQELFDALWGITTELKEKVFARFALNPDPCSAKFQPYGGEDKPSGFLSTFAGPEIDWLVYSWVGTPGTSFTNMHLTINVGAQVKIPHFGFALGTAPDIFMYMDYLPRVDFWADATYADKYLLPANERFLQLRNDGRFSPFVSQDMSMRLYQSPTSHCYMVTPNDETLTLIRETAHEMLDRWLDWFDDAEPVPEAQRPALAARDLYMRQTICERDPANAIADRLFGKAMADELVKTLWGGNRTLKRVN
ncbi:red chlorophyll catabolite reductase [Candidatus Leptofilum sp.]|uniref:red chlorophyll catabolite reductase n=1 Tax=Candidatus Leptofilum sp. TaxID=3241576 RepID=UPI003B5C564F